MAKDKQKSNASFLTREEILAVEDFQIEKVDVPEWGGHVFVRSLTGHQRDAIEAATLSYRSTGTKMELGQMKLEGLRARLCAATICDEDGKTLFTESDMKALGEKSASALDRVFGVAQRISGILRGDVDELTENLEPARSDGSGSD
ncbi:hypothetical protein ES705_07273 [subsurface metagenome]